MICHLTVSGRDFDPDRFLEGSPLRRRARIWRRGEPLQSKFLQKKWKRKTRPDSGFRLAASRTGSDRQIAAQVRQVIRFLRTHRRQLSRLRGSAKGSLDFGILWPREAVIAGWSFPPELLSLAGGLGIEIGLTVYGATRWEELTDNRVHIP
ncbi:MAG: hypothetical protein JNL10_13435 [Verrucomicrobiales bacterium]|nr:hypothetical protein [Verrucomicrobiales bacterium]